MVSIVDTMRVNRLKLFELVMRIDELEAEKVVIQIYIEKTGQNKWLNVIKSDIKPTSVNKCCRILR